MPRSIIHPTVLAVYTDNVRKLSDSRLDDCIGRLQDAIPDEPIGIRELSMAVPEIVRRELAVKSKQANLLLQEIEDALGQLETVAETEFDRRDREAEAKLPHCKECGAVLKTKKRSKK